MDEPTRLAGAHEVAQLLGCDETLVEELPGCEALLRAGTPFPEPIDRLIDHGSVWDLDEVEEWKRRRDHAWRRAPAGATP